MGNSILDELIAKGVSSDTIMAVARLIADAEITNARRAADVARQRASRDNVRGHPQNSADVHGSHRTSQDTPRHIEISNSKDKSQSKKNISPKRELPADFALSESDNRYATERGWSPAKIAQEFERFCNHATAKSAKYADWHAAWRNWVTSPFQSKANGASHGKPTTADVGRDLLAKLRAADSAADDPGRGN